MWLRFILLTVALAGLTSSLNPVLMQRATPTNALLQKRYDGFRWGAEGSLVQVEMFGDLVCPDTADAWNNVWKPLLSRFSDRVEFHYHSVPLPYHRTSFDAAQAALVYVDMMGDGTTASQSAAFAKFADAMFDSQTQTQFFNDAVAKLNAHDITARFGKVVHDLGLDRQKFEKANRDVKYNHAVRSSWKWSVAKGLYGTPMYAVNGALIPEAGTWSLRDWEALLAAL